ncbi:hypothetical protein MHB42_17925 [Lysinibacillus sp. FSL K6-0232]
MKIWVSLPTGTYSGTLIRTFGSRGRTAEIQLDNGQLVTVDVSQITAAGTGTPQHGGSYPPSYPPRPYPPHSYPPQPYPPYPYPSPFPPAPYPGGHYPNYPPPLIPGLPNILPGIFGNSR